MLGVPGQYESVTLMLSHKMDFNCCANRDGFRTDSHNYACECPIIPRSMLAKTVAYNSQNYAGTLGSCLVIPSVFSRLEYKLTLLVTILTYIGGTHSKHVS